MLSFSAQSAATALDASKPPDNKAEIDVKLKSISSFVVSLMRFVPFELARVAALAVSLVCAACGTPTTAPAGPSPEARATAKALGRGINFGNMLDAPREGDWGLSVEQAFVDLVGQPGFVQHVRLPVRWSNHASADARAVIDPAFFERVDSVVQRLLDRGVVVIIDMHHYRQLDGDALDPAEFAVDPGVLEARFLAMWRQISQRYATHGPRLLFEVYNEPHGRLDEMWNALLARAVAAIRESNPTRVLVVGPTQWNSANALPKLVLPNDPHLILTVHHYEPFGFTHQGTEWTQPPRPTGVDCCSVADQTLMLGLLDLAQSEAARLGGYPIYVGEFGAYEQASAEARMRYIRVMRQALEQRGLPWAWWELAGGFGVYDRGLHRFDADIRNALYGP